MDDRIRQQGEDLVGARKIELGHRRKSNNPMWHCTEPSDMSALPLLHRDQSAILP
jgi:hypothetical protein